MSLIVFDMKKYIDFSFFIFFFYKNEIFCESSMTILVDTHSFCLEHKYVYLEPQFEGLCTHELNNVYLKIIYIAFIVNSFCFYILKSLNVFEMERNLVRQRSFGSRLFFKFRKQSFSLSSLDQSDKQLLFEKYQLQLFITNI